jgi:hypothetical protein
MMTVVQTNGALDEGAQAAIECAAHAARRYGMRAASFRAAVVGTFRQLEKYERAVHRIERRTAVLRMQPAYRVDERLQPLPHPERIKPWEIHPEVLPDRTRVVAQCPKCEGSGRVACSSCSVAGVLGRPSRGCSLCAQGWVHCQTCDKTGRVVAWLAIERSYYEQVRVHPHYLAARVHPGVTRAKDFDKPAEKYPSRLEEDTGWVAPITDLPESLEPHIDLYRDRISGTRVQSFMVAIYSITYRTAQGRGTIEVAGRVPRVLPLSNWRPLKLRAASLVIASVLFLVMVAVPPWIMGRSEIEAPLWKGLIWAVAVATLMMGLLRSESVWLVVRRHLPTRFGGLLRAPRTQGSITTTFGTR